MTRGYKIKLTNSVLVELRKKIGNLVPFSPISVLAQLGVKLLSYGFGPACYILCSIKFSDTLMEKLDVGSFFLDKAGDADHIVQEIVFMAGQFSSGDCAF